MVVVKIYKEKAASSPKGMIEILKKKIIKTETGTRIVTLGVEKIYHVQIWDENWSFQKELMKGLKKSAKEVFKRID